MSVIKIKREAALGLFATLGYKTADKWNNAGLQTRLGKLNEKVTPGQQVGDANAQKLLDKVLKAIADGHTFEVTGEEAAAAPATEAAETPAATPPAKPAKAAKPPKAAKPAKAAKPPKAAKPAGPKGVNLKKTMPFICGQVIKKFGLKAGVTQAMVTEANKRSGRENDHQTWFNLRNAWHAIRAFSGEEVVEPATPAAAEEPAAE